MARKRRSKQTGQQRWDEAEARRELRAWGASGLSGAKFAAEQGLNPQRLFWWKKRLEAEEPRLRLIPAEVVGTSLPVSGRPAVVVRGPGGVTVEADSDGVSPSWVAALVRELAGA